MSINDEHGYLTMTDERRAEDVAIEWSNEARKTEAGEMILRGLII